MQRVLVLGPGRGKSVLSRELAGITGLPLVHLDREFWGPGWVKPDDAEWRATLDRHCSAATRGSSTATTPTPSTHRLGCADGVVLLDYSRWVAVRGVITRLLHRAGPQTRRPRAGLSQPARPRLRVMGVDATTARRGRSFWPRWPVTPTTSSASRLRNRRHAQRWLDALRAKPTRGVIDA